MENFKLRIVKSQEVFVAITISKESEINLHNRELNCAAQPSSKPEISHAPHNNYNCEASQYLLKNEKPSTAISLDLALIALEQDIIKLEQSVLQLEQHKQEAQKQQVEEKMQHLEEQANRIHTLAEQLAAEMFKFQEIAQQINCHKIYLPETQKSLLSVEQPSSNQSAPVWKFQDITIPTVIKRGYQFFLKEIKVQKPRDEAEDAKHRIAKLQQRREALESWLETQRKGIY